MEQEGFLNSNSPYAKLAAELVGVSGSYQYYGMWDYLEKNIKGLKRYSSTYVVPGILLEGLPESNYELYLLDQEKDGNYMINGDGIIYCFPNKYVDIKSAIQYSEFGKVQDLMWFSNGGSKGFFHKELIGSEYVFYEDYYMNSGKIRTTVYPISTYKKAVDDMIGIYKIHEIPLTITSRRNFVGEPITYSEHFNGEFDCIKIEVSLTPEMGTFKVKTNNTDTCEKTEELIKGNTIYSAYYNYMIEKGYIDSTGENKNNGNCKKRGTREQKNN